MNQLIKIFFLVLLVNLFPKAFADNATENKDDCIGANDVLNILHVRSLGELNGITINEKNSSSVKFTITFKLFELNKTKENAQKIFDLIPDKYSDNTKELDFAHYQNNIYAGVIKNSFCSKLDLAERNYIANFLSESIYTDFLDAIFLSPESMKKYVAYSLTEDGEPQSDYALNMAKVCKKKNKEFVEAVNFLRPENKKHFVENIFNPYKCKLAAAK